MSVRCYPGSIYVKSSLRRVPRAVPVYNLFSYVLFCLSVVLCCTYVPPREETMNFVYVIIDIDIVICGLGILIVLENRDKSII